MTKGTMDKRRRGEKDTMIDNPRCKPNKINAEPN